MTAEVPIIDLRSFTDGTTGDRRRIAAEIDSACRSIGFLVVSGHGVPGRLLHQMHDASTDFFSLPKETKRNLQVATNDDIGYKSYGSSYLTNTLGSDLKEGAVADWKESFGARPMPPLSRMSVEEKPYFALELWPASLPHMRPIYTAYFSQMVRLSETLMEAFAIGLGLDEGYFRGMIDRHLSVLAVHHYPAQPTPPKPGQMRAGAHTDFGSLTILHTGDNPRGLQVRHHDEWIDVVPEWDHFVVNIGDLMAQWTNDRWLSTLHRVVNPSPDRSQLSRQSLTFFHSPNWHASVECIPTCSGPDRPAKYAPVTSGAYTEEKLAKLRDSAQTQS